MGQHQDRGFANHNLDLIEGGRHGHGHATNQWRCCQRSVADSVSEQRSVHFVYDYSVNSPSKHCVALPDAPIRLRHARVCTGDSSLPNGRASLPWCVATALLPFPCRRVCNGRSLNVIANCHCCGGWAETRCGCVCGQLRQRVSDRVRCVGVFLLCGCVLGAWFGCGSRYGTRYRAGGSWRRRI